MVAILGMNSVSYAQSAKFNEYSPTEDFYTWVNHPWLDGHEIPADKPGVGNFLFIKQQVDHNLADILNSLVDIPPEKLSVDEKKLLITYQSYIDLNTREVLGVKPLQVELQNIAMASSNNQITTLFAELQMIGVEVPVLFGVSSDFKDASRNIVYVGQGGLGLPRDYYLSENELTKNSRQSYQNYLQTLLTLAGIENPKAQAEQVLKLETELAKIQWSEAENRNIQKIYNLSNLHDMSKLMDNLYIEEQLKILSLYQDDKPFDLAQKSYLEAFNTFFSDHNIEVWKSYLTARLLATYSEVLTADFSKAHSDFMIQLGYYSEAPKDDKKAIDYVNRSLGMLIGKAYVQHYFNESSKEKLTAVIENIKSEYHLAISQSSRMDDKTKQNALDKLNKMSFKIGYPDKWQDYSDFKPLSGKLLQNHKKRVLYEYQLGVEKLSMPVDKTEWENIPQSVNAYYDPGKNTFVLLAGILNPPFFSENATDAQIYGGIGFIIGHEIGHAFDDQGSQFDGDGNLNNWWSENDTKKFSAIKDKLVIQADRYEVLPDKYLNGALDVGEIIGDLSGAEIAFKAFDKSIEGNDKQKNNARKIFFEQLAKTWRSKYRQDFLVRIISSDPHPPGIYRVNSTLMNMPAFHDAYNTKLGDKMYRAPEDRVILWSTDSK